MIISERIFELIKEQKISQREFSRRTGIAQSTICDWKRKKTNPAADKLMAICEVLQISPYYLLTGMDPVEEGRQGHFVTDRASIDYQLLEQYHMLSEDDRIRLLDYLQHLLKADGKEGEQSEAEQTCRNVKTQKGEQQDRLECGQSEVLANCGRDNKSEKNKKEENESAEKENNENKNKVNENNENKNKVNENSENKDKVNENSENEKKGSENERRGNINKENAKEEGIKSAEKETEHTQRANAEKNRRFTRRQLPTELL